MFAEAVDHLFSCTQLFIIVKRNHINYPFQVIALREFADNDVDFFANIFLSFECRDVFETSAFRDFNYRMRIVRLFVGDVLDEQEYQHVIFVLAGVHSSAQRITTCPKGGIEFRFLNSH